MASWLVTTSDGKKYKITSPDNATEADVVAHMHQQYPGVVAKSISLLEGDSAAAQSISIGVAENAALHGNIMNSTVKGVVVGGVVGAAIFPGILLWRVGKRASAKGMQLGKRVVDHAKDQMGGIPDASAGFDRFYETAYREAMSGSPDTASWAKAFAHASGNQEEARALYIKYRVDQLKRNERKSAVPSE